MSRTLTATVAAMLAGALSLGGLAVRAQTPRMMMGQQADEGGVTCLEAMHGMMAMMHDHMGGGLMGPGSDMGRGMMDPGSSGMPGMMSPGASMGPGMMQAASSPGAMGPMDDECVALMGQMMGMMRDHMAAGMMGPAVKADMMGPGPTAAPSPGSHDAHHPGASEPAVPSGSASAPVRVAVTLTDAFRIVPASMTVPVGVPVTFVVANSGVLAHEFVVGDEAFQDAHETTMRGTGTMSHDEPGAIGVAPGETRELTMTFTDPGVTLAGCHIPGHYPAGMRATITVTP